VAEIVKAWTAATLVTGAEESFHRLAARRDDLSAEAEQECAFVLERGLEAATKWMLDTQAVRASLKELVDGFRDPVADLLSDWSARPSAAPLEAFRAEVERLRGRGVDAAFAEEVARLASAADALEVTEIAHELGVPTRTVADAYFGALDLVDLAWLRRSLPATVSGEARWERRAIGGLIEGLRQARRQLTINLLAAGHADSHIDERLHLYADQNGFQLARLRAVVDDLRTETQPTLAGMLVVMRELGRLARAPDHGRRSH
jgi:glutamate dehydrogenase